MRPVPQGRPRKMAGRGAGSGPPPPAVAQLLAGGHLYPAGGAESEGPEEEGEVSELRPRGREKVRRSASRDRLDDIVLLTRDIREGDTLNAMALQFCCSVSAGAGPGWRRHRVGNAAFSEVQNDVRLFVFQRRAPLPCAFPPKTNISGRNKCIVLVVTLSPGYTCYIQSCASV